MLKPSLIKEGLFLIFEYKKSKILSSTKTTLDNNICNVSIKYTLIFFKSPKFL